jgi:hypothetical protein
VNKPVRLDSAVALSNRQKAKIIRQQGNQRDPRPVKVPAKPPELPTPERMAMGGGELDTVHNYEEATRTAAFRFNSWHFMMHQRGKLTDDQYKTLLKYDDQWTIANRSQVKSQLNQTVGGGDGSGSFAYLDAQKNMRHWNARIGRQAANELALVVCEGLGYEGAARALFGDSARRADTDRIKNRLLEKTIPALDNYMR